MNIIFLTNPSYGCYGYSIVAKNVCKGLREAGHEVWIIGTVTAGNLIRDRYGTPNIPPYLNPYAKDALKQYIKGLNIDIVITLLDCWMPETYDIPGIVHSSKIPIISHVTTRSDPLSSWWLTFLDQVDHIIAPTWWGLGTVKEVFPNKASYIQHGVDLNVFKPNKSDRDEMRKKLGYEDKFVFLAVGRNKEMQKRYDIMFKSFKSLFTNMPELKDKIVLHIHTNPVEAYDLATMYEMGFHDLGEGHIVFSTVKFNEKKLELCHKDDPNAMALNPNWGLDEEEMAKLYNMADCFVHSGEGESFCLPCIEAQACGLPCVVPDHTSFKELVGVPESGILCKIVTEETTPSLTDVSIPDIIDFAKGMYKMYSDGELREKCSKNALENVKKYNWDEVVKKWLFIIEKVAEPRLDYKSGLMGF